MCFGCGQKNPIGLKIRFRQEDDLYVADFVPLPEHQGYTGITHGGIICTILDEAMGRFIWAQGYHGLTARLEIRFRKPVPLERPIRVQARAVSKARSGLVMESRILLDDGQVAAEAKATYVTPGEGGRQ